MISITAAGLHGEMIESNKQGARVNQGFNQEAARADVQ
jgi:hypothetical protein